MEYAFYYLSLRVLEFILYSSATASPLTKEISSTCQYPHGQY